MCAKRTYVSHCHIDEPRSIDYDTYKGGYAVIKAEYNIWEKCTMEIIKKISAKAKDLYGEPVPAIAFLGDSVTQGCFEIYLEENGNCNTVYDRKHSGSSYVSDILETLFPQVPVCIINAGISGDNALNGSRRVERDVLRFHPDLTVVGYGLNDCGGDPEDFKRGLREIFRKLKEGGSEVIYVTPNMMNTSISCHIKETEIAAIAENTRRQQVEGRLDSIAEEGRKAAAELGIPVCDIYSKWKLLYSNGVDITALLANHINHPCRKMNWLTAYSLVEVMMQ